MRIGFILLFILTVLAGCGTLDKAKLSDLSIRQKLDPLQLSIGYDVYLLRVDLRREFHSESRTVTHTDSKGFSYTSTESVSVPNAYHYIVVDFGNGIIMDYNGNLCLDLARYYHFNTNKNFSIGEEPEGLFSSKVTSDKTGDQYVKIVHALFEGKSEVNLSGNPIKINNGVFNDNLKITVASNSINFDPSGFLGLGAVTITQPDDKTVVFPNFWQNKTFTKVSDDGITLNHELDVKSFADHMEIIYSGIFGFQSKFIFLKTAAGCYFYNSDNYSGVEISKEGSIIKVFQNRDLFNTYIMNQI